MSSPALSIPVTGSAANINQYRLILEQEPVHDGELSLTDLSQMLSLVRSGISAYSYIAQSCPATMTNGLVKIPLTIYAWPSHDQEYRLSSTLPDWTTIGEQVSITQEREFDLIVENTDTVELPCLAGDLQLTWQSPAILENGAVIDPPSIYGYDRERGAMVDLSSPHGPINRIGLDRACFGVLRVRCAAIGYQHLITLEIPKTFTTSISNIQETITAVWQHDDGSYGSAAIDLDIPACVETLLESCDDGSSLGEHVSASVDETRYKKQLLFSTCTGKVLDYREIEVGT